MVYQWFINGIYQWYQWYGMVSISGEHMINSKKSNVLDIDFNKKLLIARCF